MLQGKNVIVGITGGIAAYKIAQFVRELRHAGAAVRVVMTPSATKFISPLTFSALTGEEVVISMFPDEHAGTVLWRTEHISLALWADIMIVAPASANTIAKLAHGFCDTMLTTIALALRCPLIIAPSMDADMYLHAATRENVATLRRRGVHVIEPEEGPLASGLIGRGRLPDPEKLITEIENVLQGTTRDLNGLRLLVTAGPTQEPLDPVRFIGNRSSGKMGFAIAQAAIIRGAQVVLVSGPSDLETPRGCERVRVRTAEEMKDAVITRVADTDIVIMAAAVADYTPEFSQPVKIKKQGTSEPLTITLKPTPDILREIGASKGGRTLVGFALETDHELENAKRKLTEKNLDFIVLNNPSRTGSGFGSETNEVTFVYPDGRVEPMVVQPKFDVAMRILDRAVGIHRTKQL